MWGIFAIFSVLPNIEYQSSEIALANRWCCLIIAIITSALIWIMFFSPSIAAANMFAILSLEFWYSIFAIYYTSSHIFPICLKQNH